MTKPIITRRNENNVRVEMMNTNLEHEVYSYVEINGMVQISVRGKMNKDGKTYKWSTLNSRVHHLQFNKIISMIREAGI